MISVQYQRYDGIAYDFQLHRERTPPRLFGHFESLLSQLTQLDSREVPLYAVYAAPYYNARAFPGAKVLIVTSAN